MKKRERTVNLINESETLDAQNKELKSQVSKLETEYRKLVEVLQAHGPTCVHQKGYQPLPSLSTIISGSSAGNSGKYLNDLNYLDQDQTGQGEIKYSECLKSVTSSSGGSPMDNFSKQDAGSLLPPGYCKLSPTEPTSFLLDSSSELSGAGEQTSKSDYIPGSSSSASSQSNTTTQQPTKNGRSKPGPKPRQSRAQKQTNPAPVATSATTNLLPSLNSTTTTTTTFVSKGNPLIAATLMTTTPSSSPSSVPSPLTVGNSVSAVNIINPIGTLVTADDDDFILKNELIDTQSPYTSVQNFTDLDSGITAYNSINGCLA
uniref:BZIP domain-containing protein n=1 Tax=Anopheles maculatus TaxID=74869 RepID=A0A182SU17_9DIPT